MKYTIWIFALEPLESRYTAQWMDHIPQLMSEHLGQQYQIRQICGTQNNTALTPGAFLNFSDTNFWKSTQLCNFLEAYNRGEVGPGDQFLFTDAWNPTILQIKYMSDLLGMKWQLHGLWHAGSYDPWDFLGQLIGDAAWVRNTEAAMFHALDHNYFATQFHIQMFCDAMPGAAESGKIVQTGWPMEYLWPTLAPYAGVPKEDIILFPHRIASEKQHDIFVDLASSMPQYQWITCQASPLTKHEYHLLLAKTKMVFSASNQETLGISPVEGAILGVVPFLPDRLSYTEMYPHQYLYPSDWTKDFATYQLNKHKISARIQCVMQRFDTLTVDVTDNLAPTLMCDFFSATKLINKLQKEQL